MAAEGLLYCILERDLAPYQSYPAISVVVELMVSGTVQIKLLHKNSSSSTFNFVPL